MGKGLFLLIAGTLELASMLLMVGFSIRSPNQFIPRILLWEGCALSLLIILLGIGQMIYSKQKYCA